MRFCRSRRIYTGLCRRLQRSSGRSRSKFVRNCCGVGGFETADAILWLFELSRVRLVRKKEWLCDSDESLLWF